MSTATLDVHTSKTEIRKPLPPVPLATSADPPDDVPPGLELPERHKRYRFVPRRSLDMVRMRVDLTKQSLVFNWHHHADPRVHGEHTRGLVEIESTLRTLVELGLMTRDAMQVEMLQLATDLRTKPA